MMHKRKHAAASGSGGRQAGPFRILRPARTQMVRFFATEAEVAVIRRGAATARTTVSDLIRQAALKAATQITSSDTTTIGGTRAAER